MLTLTWLWAPWAGAGADPDGPLVARAKQGDRSAFDALRRRHEQPLRGFVVRHVGPDAAEDLLQDTWLACWSGIRSYTGRSRFKAWLYGIAAHKCADCFRARPQDVRWDESLESLAAVQPDAYQAIELRHVVQAALRRLPESQREVVELYYYADLTLAEIAGTLGRNLNTVKYQFYRAHAQVAQELKGEGTAQP